MAPGSGRKEERALGSRATIVKAALHLNTSGHQQAHGAAMKAGLERHGVKVRFAASNQPVRGVDFAVIWGFRQEAVIAAAPPVLVMERGYLPDRFVWTSLGWDGLNGRARFPAPQDHGERFDAFFAQHLRPWRCKDEGDYALLIGQLAGDVATRGVNLRAWIRRTAEQLRVAGYAVRYRPHPQTPRMQARAEECPPDADFSTMPLEKDLADAALCVTWNSNTGVDAILAGVPTVAMDEGSMAWPVATHDVAAAPIRPDRHEWCRQLSWCQWTLDEIKSGAAWDALKTCLEFTHS